MNKQINQFNKEEISLRIKLLDIFPPLNDLKQQKEEIDIIFQGLNIFYNLFDLLSKKNEINFKTINSSSIIISLIKSNNLFATSLFNIKQGEQWISFTYENKKKKDTTLAQSLIDCIKIKLNCDIIQSSQIKNINSKIIRYSNLKNNSKLYNGSLLTEENNYKSQSFLDTNFHKINKANKLKTNKGNKKISLDSFLNEKTLEKSKYFLIKNNNSISTNSSNNQYNIIDKKKHFKNDNKIKERGLRRMKTKDTYSKIMEDDLANKMNKILNKNEDSKLNLTQRSSKNYMKKLDFSSKSKKNFNCDNINSKNKLFLNFGSNTTQKNKNYIIKSKLLYNPNNKAEIKNITQEYNNKKNEAEISNNNVNNSNSISNNMNFNKVKKIKYKIEKINDYIQNMNLIGSKSNIGSMTIKRNKDVIKDLKNNTSTNSKTPEITRNNKFKSGYQNTFDSKKNFLNKDKEIAGHSIYKNISYDFDLDNDEESKFLDDLSNTSNDDINNYFKLREDFILLYNENYVKNVQEDLLKLEIDLFVEKMTGLIEAYHQAINEEKIKNKIIRNNLKESSEKYITLCKLYYKLNLVKKEYKKKYLILHKSKINMKNINDKNFETNKNELQIFKLIFPYKDNEKSEKKIELKNIINIILSKLKNKKIIMNTDLYKKWGEINKDKFDNIIGNNENIKKNIDNENKYVSSKARAKAIPKLQHTKFNSKINKHYFINENKSEKKFMINNSVVNSYYNSFSHNPNLDYDIYSSNKCYSRKIPK